MGTFKLIINIIYCLYNFSLKQELEQVQKSSQLMEGNTKTQNQNNNQALEKLKNELKR